MPTYEYLCPDGHVFDRFQKMTDKPRAKCPACGKIATRKISGGAGLVFKGSGFYITDYGKDGKGPRKTESEPTAAEPKAQPKTEAKTDAVAKPEPASRSQPASTKPSSGKSRAKASDE
ncbi:MAG TPA: FmdB family zinc ribbon protein [Gemmatimonadales bacterium]|jgi:putative FmdB family regulatory protein|nr:FmdB family zinc ribbon protein [Gemmatimonadales bacterium]